MGDFHKHWRISVESHGDLIVAIETECLAGRELSETDVATVNHAISHLNGFMGNPDTITALEEENQKLREALEPFAFLHPEDPEDSAQKAWETVYLDRVKDWIDYEEIAAARAALEGE